MKILNGHLRGQSILFKPNPHLRPTSDKVRQALFNILRGHIEGQRVLDLFSGSGALGLEALSLGAAHVTFVEHEKGQAKKIKENLRRLKLEDQATIFSREVKKVIPLLEKKKEAYTLVFLDPPYQKGLAQEALEGISQSSLLSSEGLVVAECQKKEVLPSQVGSLCCVKSKIYGDTQIALFQPCHPGEGRDPRT